MKSKDIIDITALIASRKLAIYKLCKEIENFENNKYGIKNIIKSLEFEDLLTNKEKITKKLNPNTKIINILDDNPTIIENIREELKQ